MWRELIHSLSPESRLFSPTAIESIHELETTLQVSLPEDLKGLLLETNGTMDEAGLGPVWSAEQIIATNREYRRDYNELFMSFESLLLFASDYGGNLFAYAITANGEVARPWIYCWDHETDDRLLVKSDLREYLEWYFAGFP
jgi:SMI1-KNR4 cell-wall